MRKIFVANLVYLLNGKTIFSLLFLFLCLAMTRIFLVSDLSIENNVNLMDYLVYSLAGIKSPDHLIRMVGWLANLLPILICINSLMSVFSKYDQLVLLRIHRWSHMLICKASAITFFILLYTFSLFILHMLVGSLFFEVHLNREFILNITGSYLILVSGLMTLCAIAILGTYLFQKNQIFYLLYTVLLVILCIFRTYEWIPRWLSPIHYSSFAQLNTSELVFYHCFNLLIILFCSMVTLLISYKQG